MTPNQWINCSSQNNIIYALWEACRHADAAIAIWRLPQSNHINFLADFSAQSDKGRLQLQGESSGFAVSPFINPDGEETLLLKPDLHIRFDMSVDGKQTLLANNSPTGFWQYAYKQLQKTTVLGYTAVGSAVKQIGSNNKSENKNHFTTMIQQALVAIAAGEFDKVVVARTQKLTLSTAWNIIESFHHLMLMQPSACVNLLSIPAYGTWMGASPELLVATDKSNNFRTESLAGTQAFDDSIALSEVRWNQKEIEEQAMVSRYIIEQFKALRLREFVETGPRTVRAGSMLHLNTQYQVDMNAINRPEIMSEMLQLLHPTSAVCGLPKQASQQFIEANEALDRGLYSGYLGPVNIQGETHLYVNIRCMEIKQNNLILYAGAGVTHDSDPEKEWQETVLKCKTLQDAINA